MLLEQSFDELVGGPLNPPLDNVVGSKKFRSGRVKLRRICCKNLNDVAQQVKTQGKSTIFVSRFDLSAEWSLLM